MIHRYSLMIVAGSKLWQTTFFNQIKQLGLYPYNPTANYWAITVKLKVPDLGPANSW